jgi:hypothetical protein
LDATYVVDSQSRDLFGLLLEGLAGDLRGASGKGGEGGG